MEIDGEGHLEFDRAINPRSRNTLRIDLERIDHLNIYAVVGIATAIMQAVDASMAIEVTPPTSGSASAYLSRLGFHRFVEEVGGIPCPLPVESPPAPADVLVELRIFESSDQLIPLSELLLNRLEGTAGPQATNALDDSLWELGANVTEHSGSKGVLAAIVQRGAPSATQSSRRVTRRKESHLAFAIGDAGIGIRQSFLSGTGRYRPATDHEAISLALQYQVSSVDDPGRGLGLASIVEDVTGLDGRVLVRSGDTRRTVTLERFPQGNPVPKHRAMSVPKIAGTVVAVDVPCR